ncbi:DNA-binding protein [Candidatus Daviesbacteria bacterium]|nr:DNA-binding protein [Candidatus Daviesbacteria bacterium]
MRHKQFGSKFVVKLEKGEEVISSLTKFCEDNQIFLGYLSGIGAVNKATIGSYELSTKTYHWKDFSGSLEVTSLVGNITFLDNKPFIHVHINISDENLTIFGGHLREATVGVTLEIFIEKIDGRIIRKMDNEIGLNLLDLND